MRRFPQDDELDTRDIENAMAEADDHFDMMARDMRENRKYRGRLEKKLEEKTVDPLVLKAIDLAQNLGHALGANEALGNKVSHLTDRISVRDTEIEKLDEEVKRTADRDEWEESSAEWERKYKQLKNSRRK